MTAITPPQTPTTTITPQAPAPTPAPSQQTQTPTAPAPAPPQSQPHIQTKHNHVTLFTHGEIQQAPQTPESVRGHHLTKRNYKTYKNNTNP